MLRVETAQRSIKEQNDVIKAKADVKKRSRRDALPNEFETDDQFCPGCSLELKTLPTEQASLWVDLFMEFAQFGRREMPMPGLFVFYDWGLKRRLNAEWRDHITSLEHQIEALKKSLGSAISLRPWTERQAQAGQHRGEPAGQSARRLGKKYRAGFLPC